MKSPKVGIDWKLRQGHIVRRGLNSLERIMLPLESLVNRLVRDERFNPLYHTGTISVFLLLIIVITGVYISLFYQVGFESSYRAVAAIEANPLGGLMRALHRYASAAALVTALLHGWRTFFMDRFSGPRWLAWVTGVAMALIVWAAGVTGYWLIWDERAAVFNDTLARLLSTTTSGTRFLLDFINGPRVGSGWEFVLLVLTLHIGITVLLMVFYLYHIKRLSRPKWFPPRFWMLGLGGLLLLAAILLPADMLPAFQPGRLPAAFPGDLFFLFYLPAALNLNPWVVWGGALLLLTLVALIPWLLRRPSLLPIHIHAECCTGCTLCAEDCPYTALRMVERSDDSGHRLLAVLEPGRCVSCGVCIGSCPTLALTLGAESRAETLWDDVLTNLTARSANAPRIVFTCERHAQQGAAAFLENPDPATIIVPLTCIGMAHPDLAEKALAAGAVEVRFIGCPPEDCANREGNLWMQQRLDRQRQPLLRQDHSKLPLFTSWLPPDQFQQGLTAESTTPPTAYPAALAPAKQGIRPTWPNFLPALVLMGVVLAGQLALTSFPFQVYPSDQARLKITLQHRLGSPFLIAGSPVLLAGSTSAPIEMKVFVDDVIQLETRYAISGSGLRSAQNGLELIDLSAGQHRVEITLSLPGDESLVVFDQPVRFSPGEVVPITIQDARLSGDPYSGERLFNGAVAGKNTGCLICHSLEPDQVLVGPSLSGVAVRAASRVPGMSVQEYLRQSIVEPDAYVVAGFPAGQMVPTYLDLLTAEEIDDLIAFLETLK